MKNIPVHLQIIVSFYIFDFPFSQVNRREERGIRKSSKSSHFFLVRRLKSTAEAKKLIQMGEVDKNLSVEEE